MTFPSTTLRFLGTALCLTACLMSRGQASDLLHWKSSTASSLWADKPDVAVVASGSVPSTKAVSMWADPQKSGQVIDGWGGCFNERGWKAMEVLAPEARQELLRNLFDAKEGLNLNFCRMPIGTRSA